MWSTCSLYVLTFKVEHNISAKLKQQFRHGFRLSKNSKHTSITIETSGNNQSQSEETLNTAENYLQHNPFKSLIFEAIEKHNVYKMEKDNSKYRLYLNSSCSMTKTYH